MTDTDTDTDTDANDHRPRTDRAAKYRETVAAATAAFVFAPAVLGCVWVALVGVQLLAGLQLSGVVFLAAGLVGAWKLSEAFIQTEPVNDILAGSDWRPHWRL